MWLIALSGLIMIAVSLRMVFAPDAWAATIISLCSKRWFHPFEILTRAFFAAAFLLYADETLHPVFMRAAGYLLLAVAIGLALTPPSKHMQFGVWAANKFRPLFRPAGAATVLLGAFIVYSAVAGP